MLRYGFSELTGSWKIIEIFEPLTRLSSRVVMPSNSWPRNFTDPSARPFSASKPIIAIAVCVLPDPDSPTTPRVWPGSRSKLKPLTACTTPSGVSNRTVRSRTSSRATTVLLPVLERWPNPDRMVRDRLRAGPGVYMPKHEESGYRRTLPGIRAIDDSSVTRVERVAQPVTQEVERKQRRGQEHGREQQRPGRGLQ